MSHRGDIARLVKVLNIYQLLIKLLLDIIYLLLKDNPKITRSELALKTGLTENGVKWNLSKLKSEGRIKRIGPDKGGYWKIINNDE